MRQFLNFFPLPQGQGSFRPTFCLASGLRGSISRGAGGTGGLALRTSAAFLPVSFSRANSHNHLGVALKFLHPLSVLFLLGLLDGKPLVVFGKPFPGTEQEISSGFEHLEGHQGGRFPCLDLPSSRRSRLLCFLPQEHSACMGLLPRLHPAPRSDESIMTPVFVRPQPLSFIEALLRRVIRCRARNPVSA